MKKKTVVTILTLALSAMVFAGCGSSQESAAAASYEETGPAVYADEAEEEPAISTEPATSVGLEDVTGENDDFGRPPEDECVAWEEDDGIEEEVVVAETGEIEGIIVVQNYFYHADDGVSNIFVYSVQAVNPNTGESTKIAEFSVRRPYNVTSEDSYYLLPLIGDTNMVGYDQRYFSSDFSKMAATKIINDKNEAHAGWFDQSGNFFDVTEALGEQSSDFGDPVTYNAVGFTEDDLFVYNDNPYAIFSAWAELNFRFTDLNALNISQEGNPLDDSCQIINGNKLYAISDYIDDTMCLVYYHDKGNKTVSAKYDMNSGEVIPYIPGESRSNWSGVSSPDGSQIAFLSMPKEGNGNPEIFIIPFEGGEPEKLNCDIVFSNDTSTSPSSILEWR